MRATPRTSFRSLAALAVVVLSCLAAAAQTRPAAPAAPSTRPAATDPRIPIDRIVAIVNGDLILESDVDAEQRFGAFEPLHSASDDTRGKIVNRLIDRDLILQQMQMQPLPPITDAEVDAELAQLRKEIPACAAYHCDTEEGWKKFAADHGFTVEEVRDRWRTRMQVLRFIEQRFRMGYRVPQSDIDAYYKDTLLPSYVKQGVQPPPESAIADRIQGILLERQVTALLDDWLKALRAQGSVRIMNPEDAPR